MTNNNDHDSSSTNDIRVMLYYALPDRLRCSINGKPHVRVLRHRGYQCVPISELTKTEVRRLGRACGLLPCPLRTRTKQLKD